MYYLSQFCLLCLNSQQLKSVLMHDDKGITMQEQLSYCLPEITISKSGFPEFICSSCYEIVHSYCKFKKKCLENYSRLIQYTQILQEASGSRGQKFTELRIQTKKHVMMELEQDIRSELNVKENIEDSSSQSLEELGQKTDNIVDGEELDQNFTDFRQQMNNQELMREQEQKVDSNINIKIENEVFLPSLEECDEKLAAFDIGDVKEEFVEPENCEDHEFNVQCEYNNEQDSVSRSSCESDNQLNMDADTVNVNAMCNNRDISGEERKDYKCPVCNKCFPEPSSLYEHMNIHENIGDCTPYCQICHKQFSTKKNLGRHLKLHAGIRNFKCTICSKNFAAKSTLETHIKMHVGVRNYECSLCGKKYVAKSHLTSHLKLHAGIKNYECSVCGKKFDRNSALNLHMRKHTDIRNFKCSVCDKKFKQKAHLNTHMKIHETTKDCPICDIKFVGQDSLNKHLKVHMKTFEKNYNCPVCDMKFVEKDALNEHLKVHEYVVLYECSICNMKFVSNIKLDEHMTIHSANKSEPASVPKSAEYILGLE